MIHKLTLDSRDFITDFSVGVQIGDVMIVRNGALTFYSNIFDEIPYDNKYVRVSPASQTNIQTGSSDSLSVNFNAAASVPGMAQGDLLLKFNSQKSEYISLKNVNYQELDRGALGQALDDYWSKHGFTASIEARHQTILVGLVLHADSGTYLFSESSDNQVVVKASDGGIVAAANVTLSGEVNVAFSNSTVQSVISPTPFQPLFGALHNLIIGGWQTPNNVLFGAI